MIIAKRNAYIGLACLAIAGVLYPDSAQKDAQHRALEASTTADDEHDHYSLGRSIRGLGDDLVVGIWEFETPLSCANAGEEFGKFDWDQVSLDNSRPNPQIFPSGPVTMKISRYEMPETGAAKLLGFEMHEVDGKEYPRIGIRKRMTRGDLITSGNPENKPSFPNSFVRMEIELDVAVRGLVVSNGDVDSKGMANVVRIRMFDDYGIDIPLALAVNHPKMLQRKDYAWMNVKQTTVDNPGFDASLYAKPKDPNDAVKRITLDLGLYAFEARKIGQYGKRWMYPALDFKFCKNPAAVLPSPPLPPADNDDDDDDDDGESQVTKTSTAPTASPVDAENNSDDLSSVSGDPIIMGLGGQVFKFNGNTGAWYSAVSARSFQWNMRVNKFEGCPIDSDTFTTGMGLTVFGDGGTRPDHRFEVSIVNPASVFTGCGNHDAKENDFGCLGAGSLQLVVDGHKVVQSIDKFLVDDEDDDDDDHSAARVIAYNTISKCSRRWFDFDVTPSREIQTRTGKSRALVERQIRNIGIYDAIDSVRETMVDKDGCRAWLDERRTNDDLMRQTGTWSTVIIQTEAVSFHIEYRQEMERCHAHNLDIWITNVAPNVALETWEGVVGETKPNLMTVKGREKTRKRPMSRHEVLKYETDGDYEVVSPFSTSCRACVDRRPSQRSL